jgi:hypothetical protein
MQCSGSHFTKECGFLGVLSIDCASGQTLLSARHNGNVHLATRREFELAFGNAPSVSDLFRLSLERAHGNGEKERTAGEAAEPLLLPHAQTKNKFPLKCVRGRRYSSQSAHLISLLLR